MKKPLALIAALVGLTAVAVAQQGQPRGKAEAMVGGKKVVIDYGRPDLKGRELGALMKDLPEDRIWRAGENQVTTLDTATALQIGGKTLPAGKYSLYVHAAPDGQWSLCVNKNLGVPLAEIWAQAPAEMAKEPWPELRGYDAHIKGDEVARIPMKKKSGGSTDVFTIGLTANELTMSWGDMAWGVGIAAGS